MNELAELTLQAHEARRSQQPATVRIAGKPYPAARTGFRSEQELKGGDFIAVRKISFEVAASLFAVKEQPRPALPLDWIEGAMSLEIESALPDPTGAVYVLRCKAPPQ